jgi:hypothetical protein
LSVLAAIFRRPVQASAGGVDENWIDHQWPSLKRCSDDASPVWEGLGIVHGLEVADFYPAALWLYWLVGMILIPAVF